MPTDAAAGMHDMLLWLVLSAKAMCADKPVEAAALDGSTCKPAFISRDKFLPKHVQSTPALLNSSRRKVCVRRNIEV